MNFAPGILARGPWPSGSVATTWLPSPYPATDRQIGEADEAIARLRERGSPTHDGLAGRLASFEAAGGNLRLELQVMRWALRLIPGDASDAISAMCVVRNDAGEWLAGRRADWVASWPRMWSLGASGAVEPGEDPVDVLERELDEEWSVAAARLEIEALLATAGGMVLFVGQAWLAPGTEVTRDHEHDEHAWWPANPAEWPDVAHPQLRRLASLLLV